MKDRQDGGGYPVPSARESVLVVSHDLVGRARITDGQGGAVQGNFVELVSESSSRASPTDPLQSLPKGLGDCQAVSLVPIRLMYG